jgi:hypothetical protein
MGANTYDKCVVQSGVWRVPTATSGPVASHHTSTDAPLLGTFRLLIPQSCQARVHQLKLQLLPQQVTQLTHIFVHYAVHIPNLACVSVFQDHPSMMLCSR